MTHPQRVGGRRYGLDRPAENEKVGLPIRPFLYTLDQIAGVINVKLDTLAKNYVYYEGRSTGGRYSALLVARNIAPDDMTPEWRVSDREFIRWMRVKGFKYYERGSFS